jgi:ABC-type Zn uptake system ZnuABC Zn-binding protein ZnuA
MRLRGAGRVILGVLAAVGLAGCSGGPDWPDRPGLRVMVTFPPLYCFVANVVGDDAVVQTLLDGTGVHAYHPSPRDSIRLHRANLFFVNGLDLDEQFARTLAENADNKGLIFVEVGEAPALKERLIKMKKHGHSHDHGHAHGHKHGEFDPHIWLGLPEAIAMVDVIRDQLIEADPDPRHKENYKTNAEAYTKTLRELLASGVKELKGKKDKKLVTYHDSLAYFVRPFDLQIIGTIQPYAGEDAPARRMADLVNLCKKEGVRVVVAEPGATANTEANSLVAELRTKGVKEAEKVEIDLLESVPRSQLTKDYYEKKMKANIEVLAKALK